MFLQSSFSGTCNTGRKFLSLFVYIVMMIVLPSGRKRLRCRNLFNRFEDIYSYFSSHLYWDEFYPKVIRYIDSCIIQVLAVCTFFFLPLCF